MTNAFIYYFIRMKQQKKPRSNNKKEVQAFNLQQFQQNKRKSLSLRQIKQNYASLPQKQAKIHHSKPELISKLSKQLLDKLKIDVQARDAILSYDQQKIRRLEYIQSQIEKMNQENATKMDQLGRMEKTIFKRMEKEAIKDKLQEEKLKKQYEKLLKEEERIALTKSVKQLKEKEDWAIIEKEQRRLQFMIRVLENRHLAMGRDKSHELKEQKKQKSKELQKVQSNSKSPKKQHRKKNAQQLKEMGRQFLEHAKKVQAENLKNNTKVLDVYQKSIDYLPEIRTILKSNTDNLSKPIQNQTQQIRSKRKKGGPAKTAK